jgi:phosphoribosylanthranilate isomerase
VDRASGRVVPPPRLIVKVCGLTRLEDAQTAVRAGADWLGFVVKWEGPRRIAPEAAADIVAAVGGVTSVAVMVGPGPDEALRLARAMGAGRVQLHRVRPLEWPRDFPLPVTFSVPVASDGSLTEALPREDALVLLDAADARLPGGTGRGFPWDTARVVAATRDTMLAGGLDAETVGEAIAHVRPFGVDASSRLEREPGVKDPERVRRYVVAARAAASRLEPDA